MNFEKEFKLILYQNFYKYLFVGNLLQISFSIGCVQFDLSLCAHAIQENCKK